MGLYGVLVIPARTLFVAPVLGTLTAFAVFFSATRTSGATSGPVPRTAALPAAALATSSGLLFSQYRCRESYSSPTEVLFVSAVNFLWMAPVLFFI